MHNTRCAARLTFEMETAISMADDIKSDRLLLGS